MFRDKAESKAVVDSHHDDVLSSMTDPDPLLLKAVERQSRCAYIGL